MYLHVNTCAASNQPCARYLDYMFWCDTLTALVHFPYYPAPVIGGPLPPLCTLYSGAKTLSTSLISPVFSFCWRFDYLRPVNTRISHLFPSHVAIKFILTFKILVEYLRLSCLCNPPRKLKTRTLYRSFALIQSTPSNANDSFYRNCRLISFGLSSTLH